MPRHSNWVTAFSTINTRRTRYEPPEQTWMDLQTSLQRWGSGYSWSRYEQLGDIADTSQGPT